jgi:Holliday junction resolvasome RuvABC endonuclease subunit
MPEPIIIGIDPGTKEMGVAVLRGADLLGQNVHTLRNGTRPHDVIGQARQLVLGYVADYAPAIVAIEKPYLLPTKRAALLSVIEQELAARANELHLQVIELSPEEIRLTIVGNPRATKLDVARALVRAFPNLAENVPKRPKRAALGLSAGDRYWLHMFDALAVAVAVRDRLDTSPQVRKTPTRPPAYGHQLSRATVREVAL